MQDTIVAFFTNKEAPKIAWKFHAGFGYEHTPSSFIEKDGKLFFGTKNGVVYCMDPANQKMKWAYKIDNSMVNTLNVISSKQIIASTMDGQVVLLQEQ
jgi:outer membrane protein assembly factor BamB